MNRRYDLDAVKQQMDRDGFAPLRGFMSPDLLEALRRRTAEVEAEEGDLAIDEVLREHARQQAEPLAPLGAAAPANKAAVAEGPEDLELQARLDSLRALK